MKTNSPLPSLYQVGGTAYFQPNLRLIDAKDQSTNPEIAAPCEITAVKFAAGKVRYDIDVIYVESYDGKDTKLRAPIRDVDSIMICVASPE